MILCGFLQTRNVDVLHRECYVFPFAVCRVILCGRAFIFFLQPSRLNANIYQNFRKNILSRFLEFLSLNFRNGMSFRNEEAPPHFYENANPAINHSYTSQ